MIVVDARTGQAVKCPACGTRTVIGHEGDDYGHCTRCCHGVYIMRGWEFIDERIESER